MGGKMKTLKDIEYYLFHLYPDMEVYSYACRQIAQEWIKLIEEYEKDDNKCWYCLTCKKDCTESTGGGQWTVKDECENHTTLALSSCGNEMRKLIKHIFNLEDE